MHETIKTIISNLSAFFRHVMPGVVVLSIAWASHPQWFCGLSLRQAQDVWILAVAALVLGNIFYIVHRNTVHQAIDWVVWFLIGRNGEDYITTIGKMTIRHFGFGLKVREYMHLRNSQVVLMCVTGELLFIASIWKDDPSIAKDYAVSFGVIGAGIFVGAAIAHGIAFALALRLADTEQKTTGETRKAL